MSENKVPTSGGGYYDPWRHAYKLGVHVYVTAFPGQDPDNGVMGYYVNDERMIYLRSDLSQNQMRAVLAHEVEHARLRHLPITGAADRARDLRADRAAALRLMPDADWRDATSSGEKLRALDKDKYERFLANHFRVDLHAVRIRLAMEVAR